MASWELVGSILSLKLSMDTYYVPSAKEIYQIAFKGENTICGEIVPQYPAEISFSRFPVDLKIIIQPYNGKEVCELYLQVALFIRNEIVHLIEFNSKTPDHIVLNDTWYPFAPGDIEYIRDILTKATISTSGKISLKQYLALKSNVNNDSKLIDEVPDGIKKYSKIISRSDEKIPMFVGKLYPYQEDGFKWLKMIAHEDAGCILGDEMGLGKTIQIIALLASEKSESRQPALVVSPPTLLENWRREILKFAPDIKHLVHKGHDRTGFHSTLRKYDVVITSYETVLKDLPMFKMIDWNLIILDEAHSIKNPYAKRTILLKQLKKRVAIAVTGTPIQNRLVDLWSVIDFVLPGFLGDLSTFESQYADSISSAERLEQIISPVLLRRLVSEVANDLPERIDVPQALEMSGTEIIEYEEERKKIIEEYGNNASLVSIAKLRMYCTHPFLLNNESGDPADYSTKYQRLLEILQEILDMGEKVLIFTSYSKMIDILVTDIVTRFGVFCSYIDGRVEMGKRQWIIDSFGKVNSSAILVLNPRAAGVGLNITTANHVIHYNLEWNPAVEDQASARAYRRGQDRPVTVHRLYYVDTVEEVINMRIDAKRMLFQSAVVGHDGSRETYKDILKAISMSPRKGNERNEL